jgi:squalene-hopene/tetraprenyl-beta-curcumene cyclase
MNPELVITAGMEHLRRRRSGGRWSAFHLYPGVSDEWVTAYVAASLAEAGAAGAVDLAGAALAGLAHRQRPDGLFGFNARAVGDADSTLWALRLATAAGAVPPSWDAGAALAALSGHVRADGGMATYAADEPIRTIAGASPGRPPAGWCAAHPCVTAVAAGLPATAARAVRYLLDTQDQDGSWPAYWWTEREYTVAHAVEALAAVARRETHPAPPRPAERPGAEQAPEPASDRTAVRVTLHRAADWAASRFSADGTVRTPTFPDGSPFATALALRAVLAGTGATRTFPVSAAVDWLCRNVRLDGSWLPSAVLRVPHPYDTAPESSGRTTWVPGGRKTGAVVVDRSGVFTAATVVAALARALRTEHTPVRLERAAGRAGAPSRFVSGAAGVGPAAATPDAATPDAATSAGTTGAVTGPAAAGR